MSLYSQIFGVDEFALSLLTVLKLNPHTIPRFRDCYLNEDRSRIVVLTRTGGGNRGGHAAENAALAEHPFYERDEDAAGDATYAYFYFRLPEPAATMLKQMFPDGGRKPAVERFMTLARRLNDPRHADDPDVKRAKEAGKRIFEGIAKGGGIVEV